MTTLPPPAVGTDIYVPTQWYMDHGADDFQGGLARVTKVEPWRCDPQRLVVEVAERPGHGYFWDVVAPQQAKLAKEHGAQRAHPDPDDHPDANLG